MSKEIELSVLSNMLPQIDEHLLKVTEKHDTVSKIKTPESQIH